MGLSEKERQLLNSYNHTIEQRKWLENIDKNDPKEVDKALRKGFASISKVGDKQFYYDQYMYLIRKSKIPDAPKADESEILKKIEIPKMHSEAPESSRPDSMQKVYKEMEFVGKRISDAAQVIINWDENGEIFDEAEAHVNGDVYLVKHENDAPIYNGFEADLANLKYEYFDKSLKNAEGINGVSTKIADTMKKDIGHITKETSELDVIKAADDFIKAVDKSSAEKGVFMDDERELILRGLEILCHPSFKASEIIGNTSAADIEKRNEVFKKICKLTSDRAQDLEERTRATGDVSKAYGFIYEKAGYAGIEYYQWVTSLNSSLEVLRSRNRFEEMKADLDAGLAYREALDDYYWNKADVNFLNKVDYDAELRKLDEQKKEVDELEKQYNDLYLQNYDKKVASWNNRREELKSSIEINTKTYDDLAKEKSEVEKKAVSLANDINARIDKLEELKKQSAEEERKIKESIENSEKEWNEYVVRIANGLKAQETETYEMTLDRINAWTKERGLGDEYTATDANDYKFLNTVKENLDVARKDIDTYRSVQQQYESDAELYFSSRNTLDLPIETDMLPPTEGGYAALSDMLCDANMANRALCESLIKLTKAADYKDQSNKDALLEGEKAACLNIIESLGKAYDFGNICDAVHEADADDFRKRYDAEREKLISAPNGMKSDDVADSKRVYKADELKNMISASKDVKEMIASLNKVLDRGQKYWNRLETACSAQIKAIRTELDEELGKRVNEKALPLGMTLKSTTPEAAKEYFDIIDKSFQAVIKARDDAEKAYNEAKAACDAEKAKVEEKERVVAEKEKNISIIGFLNSDKDKQELKNAKEDLEEAKKAFEKADDVRHNAEGDLYNAKIMLAQNEETRINAQMLLHYADAKERYDIIGGHHKRNIAMNVKTNEHRKPDFIRCLAAGSDETKEFISSLEKQYKEYEENCKKQMIEKAQAEYVRRLTGISADVTSQVQFKASAAIEENIAKNDEGNTLGEQIKAASEEIKKLQKEYDAQTARHREIIETRIALSNKIEETKDTLIKEKKENEAALRKLEKIRDDYVMEKASLGNNIGIVKHELPTMCGYFTEADKHYGRIREKLNLMSADNAEIGKSEVDLEKLPNGRLSNGFRSEALKKLRDFHAAINLRHFWSNNSDEFTKMVNSIGEAIGECRVDNSGKKKAGTEGTNCFAEGTLEDCRKKLEAIKLAAEKYVSAKKDQKWILLPSDLRVHRIQNASIIINYVESCLDQLTGNKKEYAVSDAAAANADNAENAAAANVKKGTGLIDKYQSFNKSFNKLIKPAKGKENVFESFAKNEKALREGIGSPSDPKMQAFMNNYFKPMTLTAKAADNEELSKCKLHIYVDKQNTEMLKTESKKEEKGLFSSIFGAVKDFGGKIAGVFAK